MGGQGSNGPCVGNHDSVSLYNNATDGAVLRVYGFNINVGTSCQILFKKISGTVGILVPDGVAASAIDPRTPQQPGQIWRYSTATPQGVGFGGVTCFANIDYDFNFGYPIAIVPPTYTFGLEPSTTNTAITASFRWLAVYE